MAQGAFYGDALRAYCRLDMRVGKVQHRSSTVSLTLPSTVTRTGNRADPSSAIDEEHAAEIGAEPPPPFADEPSGTRRAADAGLGDSVACVGAPRKGGQ